MSRKVYSVADVQEALGLARNSVMALLLSGKLRSIRAGRRWLIPSSALTDFLDNA